MRFLIPILLILVSGAGFFMLVMPKYEEISNLRNEVAAYDKALENARTLENERDKLVTKYSSINTSDLTRLQKLLPDNIDNIRVILEIEKLARAYGMDLKNIRYDDKVEETEGEDKVVSAGSFAEDQNQEYGTWNMEFSTEGSYNNFLALTKDIERNLRLVDIVSVDFSSASSSSNTARNSSDAYNYTFKIKTYWLKK